MTPLETLPARFAPQASDEDAGTLACHELTLRFDWEKVRLDYFWKAESRRPQRASMLANGCSLFEFEKIVFDAWRRWTTRLVQSIQDRLKTSSLVELLVEGELPQPLLVQEVNMDQKPPLLEQLTAAEILEYWSLLTQDQRNDFLERKLAACWNRPRDRKELSRRSPRSRFSTALRGSSTRSRAWKSTC